MSDPRPRLGERYELLGQLSSGPSGAVWCGRHLDSGNGCAVRILEPGLAADPEAASALLTALGQVGRLSHAGIVAVDDVASGDGCSALVMPLISGESLRARLARLGALDPAEVVPLIAQLCDALAAAHAAELAHGRIKPSNILLEPGAGAALTVKLTDFGMAATEGRGVLGTPRNAAAAVSAAQYRAPELEFAKPATAAADVYAVGTVLYEMLVGHPPFTGSRALDIAELHRQAPLPRVPEVPDPFWPLLVASLAKQPDERPAAADLASMLRGITPTAPADSEPSQPRTQPVVDLPPFGVSQRPTEPVVMTVPDASGRRPRSRRRSRSRSMRGEFAVSASVAALVGGITYAIGGPAVTLPGVGSIALPATESTTQSAPQVPGTTSSSSDIASPSPQEPASPTSLPSLVLVDSPITAASSTLLIATVPAAGAPRGGLPIADPIGCLENLRAMIREMAAQGRFVLDPDTAADLDNLLLGLENSVIAYQQNGGQAYPQQIRNKIASFDGQLSLLVSQGQMAQGAADQLATYLRQLSPA